MSTFADSSALVKLYADEADHEAVRSLDVIVVSAVARVEVPAALWRKRRLGELDSMSARVLVDDFEADFFGDGASPPRFAVTSLTDEVLEDAARLVAVHPLRALDAVQFAGARAAREADPDCRELACFDLALRSAAAAEGFAVVP